MMDLLTGKHIPSPHDYIDYSTEHKIKKLENKNNKLEEKVSIQTICLMVMPILFVVFIITKYFFNKRKKENG